MQFQNEDGLTFNCKALDKCKFDLESNSYVAVINLDDDKYALFSGKELLGCIRGSRNFVSKYKIPVKVYEVISDSKGNKCYIEVFKYTYDDYLLYLKRCKR